MSGPLSRQPVSGTPRVLAAARAGADGKWEAAADKGLVSSLTSPCPGSAAAPALLGRFPALVPVKVPALVRAVGPLGQMGAR